MGRFGDDKIETVRERADIVEVIGAHVRLKRAGRNFVGLCPFHQEKTPSFSVNAERGFFHCFGCGAGGSVFNFVMKMEGLTFPEAVRSIARRYGVDLPETETRGGPTSSERDSMYRANEVASDFFAHVLWNTGDGAAPREYLARRGVGNDTTRAFKLGFAPARPASLLRALEKRSLKSAGEKLGLLRTDASGAHDMFRGRLMFPIRDTQGRVVAFGGRVLDDRLPKYINSPESPLYSKARTLYGINEARHAIVEKDRALLVEGYFDVIMLWQAGFRESVAGCGTALTVEQLRLLGRLSKNVIACFDGDSAGRKASLRALEIFLGAGLLGRGIFIPAGFDPDTFVREHDAAAFAELVESAELLIDYFLAEQTRESGKSLEGRARAAQRVAEVLRIVRNPFEFDLLARKAAPMLGVGEELLRRESRIGAQRGSAGRKIAPDAKVAAAGTAASAGDRAEIGLVALAILRPDLRAEIAALGAERNFEAVELARALMDVCSRDESHQALEGWAAEHLSPAQQAEIAAMAMRDLIAERESALKLAGDYALALDRRRRDREMNALKQSARISNESEDGAGAAAQAAQALISLRRKAEMPR